MIEDRANNILHQYGVEGWSETAIKEFSDVAIIFFKEELARRIPSEEELVKRFYAKIEMHLLDGQKYKTEGWSEEYEGAKWVITKIQE